MAVTGKYMYTDSDAVLTTSAVAYSFLDMVKNIVVRNLGNGGTEDSPKTTGGIIIVEVYNKRTGGETWRIPPGFDMTLPLQSQTQVVALRYSGATRPSYVLMGGM